MSEGFRDTGRWRRRALTFPLVYLLTTVALLLAPLVLLCTIAIDLTRRARLAITRGVVFVLWLLFCESWGLLAMFGLWLARPLLSATRYRDLSYGIQSAWTGALCRGIIVLYSMSLEVEGAECMLPGPVLLLGRHASTADTVLPMMVAVTPFGLQARYVLKRELLWDPCLDLHGQRFPNAFIKRGAGARDIAQITALLDDLRDNNVIVLYPEGTRYSPRRHARRLAKLEERDDPMLDHARSLHHTLPPHSGGVLALLDRAPELDVVLFAHVGLDRVRTLADAFNGSLINNRLQVKLWRVPAATIPRDDEGRRRWLYEEWIKIDRWVGDRAGTK